MAVWSEASFREVNDSTRIDADYYEPKYLEVRDKLSWGRPLKEYARSLIHPAEFLRRYSDDGWRVIRTQNVRPLCMDYSSNEVFLESSVASRIDQNHLIDDDILITRTGANFGQCSLFYSNLVPSIATSHTFILKTNCEIDPAYLALFLNTYHGRLLINRGMYGSSQPEIAPKYLLRIPVPRFSAQVEADLSANVRRAYTLRHESLAIYTQAQQLLESELGLDKLRFDKPVGYTARFSELELSRRFDSEHYFPAFDNLKANLPKQVQLAPLGSLLTFCQRGKQPVYAEHGFPVLNSKHVLENKITLEGNRYAKPNPLASLQIQYGDVLINGTGRGTIGRTAPYLVYEHQAIPDNHVTILRSPTLDPAYLSFYLNTQAGKLQVEKYQRGSSGQLELYPFDIRKFQVWNAPQSIQQEIRRLYDQATESTKQSRELLDQAKSRVEQLIDEAVQA
jgi:restriction endonuclease S subunit